MTSILSRLLTSDKPWPSPYTSMVPRPQVLGSYSVVPTSTTGTAVLPVQSGVEPTSTTTVVRPDSSREGYPPRHSNSVRFGRVPKREKAKILAAMQKVNASSQEKALGAELEDELKLLSTIVRAHEETCDYTKDKVQVLIEKAREHPVYAQCPQQLACPLNSAPHIIDGHYMEDFSERFTPAIQGVVEFAKRIPGFSFLSQDDQLTLLKAGVFEVLLVRLACMFDSRANTLISLNGQVLRRESLHSASNARFLLDSMFDFAERLNALHLSDNEVGLFSAVVVIAADRPGLRNTELVLKIQKKLMDILQKSVSANHPENPNIFADLMKKIPDLRTLNTLHSEKLLAYKMEPRNQSASSASSSSPVTAAVTNGTATMAGPNIYATIPHEIWSQYSLAHPPCLTGEEDLRSTSPGQQSEHSGTSTVSEWSTTDSKDEHDLMGSPRSVGSGLCIDDAKSPPMRTSSFSSSRSYHNEDGWPSATEMQHNGEFRGVVKRAANGSEHGSSSGDEGYFMDSPIKTPVYPKLRRVDSPTDSGIESGKEHGPSTTPTISVCSSPRSAVDEKVKDMDSDHSEKQDSGVEDMPVLKRALQAPPLVNTNMLMDEAYRHHKKFRAARRDAESPSSPSGISLASTHSTLVRTLEQAPRYLSEQQLKRTDLIHNIIMRSETLPAQQQQSPVHHQSHSSQQQLHHQQLPHSEIQQQQTNGTSGSNLHIAINGSSYPFSSVPNPVPPSYTSPQQKNLLVCPSGYYIPNGNATATIYSAGSPVSSWSSGQQQQQSNHSTITTVPSSTVVSPSTIHGQYSTDHHNHHHNHHHQPQQQQQPQSCPATIQQQVIAAALNAPSSGCQQSLSPRLVYSTRSPSAAAVVALSSPSPPTLVIGGASAPQIQQHQQCSSTPSPSTSLSSSSSPPSMMCQLESRLKSALSPVNRQAGDNNNNSTKTTNSAGGESQQPLNLSKKLFTAPTMLKMES